MLEKQIPVSGSVGGNAIKNIWSKDTEHQGVAWQKIKQQEQQWGKKEHEVEGRGTARGRRNRINDGNSEQPR